MSAAILNLSQDTSNVDLLRKQLLSLIEEAPVDMKDNVRVEIINDLHKLAKISPYIIGEILVQQDLILQERFIGWKKSKNLEFEQWNVIKDLQDRPPRTLHEWFQKNTGQIVFTYSMAREYIKIYRSSGKDMSDKLGPAKMIAINRIPRKYSDIKELIQDQAIENNWTVSIVQSKVDEHMKALSLREEKEITDPEWEKILISFVVIDGYSIRFYFSGHEEVKAAFAVFNDKLQEIKKAMHAILCMNKQV